MEAPLVVSINKKQAYTQSPAAYIDFLGNGAILLATSLSQQTFPESRPEAPPIRIIYHQDQTNMANYDLKLQEMKKLKGGWNGYSAPAPEEIAIATAKNFISVLLKEHQEPKKVVPSAAGGVGVTQRRNGKKVFVEFFNDGKVFALFSDGSSEPVSREIVPTYQAFKYLTAEMQDYLDA